MNTQHAMNEARYVITRYDADAMRSKVVGSPFYTVEEALKRIERLEASGRYRFPLMVDLASAFAAVKLS